MKQEHIEKFIREQIKFNDLQSQFNNKGVEIENKKLLSEINKIPYEMARDSIIAITYGTAISLQYILFHNLTITIAIIGIPLAFQLFGHILKHTIKKEFQKL